MRYTFAFCMIIICYFGVIFSQNADSRCTTNTDCSPNSICEDNICVATCSKTCGINAQCEVENHVPTCTCILDIMEGDPDIECINPELTPVDFTRATATETDVTFEFYRASSGLTTISNLNSKRATVVIIHGYNGSKMEEWVQTLTNEYRKLQLYNIILVNWTPAAGPSLSVAGNNVKIVGTIVAKTLLRSKLQPKDIHIVGFALGSHVAGHAGKYIKSQTGRILGRITALEASSKMEVAGTPPESRLNKTDAIFVSAVHTNSRRIGYKKPIGHCDWYANYGSVQPGCEIDPSQTDFCSHKRAITLFIESVSKTALSEEIVVNFDEDDNAMFTKLHRPRKITFGQWVSPWARGVYLLETRSTTPYLE